MRGGPRLGIYFVEKGASQRASKVIYDRANSSIALAKKEDFDWETIFDGVEWFHFTGITPALGPGGVALAQAAVAAADAAGVPICFDGNYRALLWDAWDSDPRAILGDLMRSATVMIGNHRDISLLLGTAFSGDGADRRREAALAAFDAFPKLQLIASTARHVASAGNHRIAARVDTRVDAFQTTEIDVTGIVDRIGTGDAFAVGVLHAWMDGADINRIAETGLACTALKHTVPGDMSLITAAELQAFSAAGADVRR